MENALVEADARRNYGEQRYIAIGRIDARLHVLVFTQRGGVVRVIGLRKADAREVHRYEKAQEA